MKISLHKYIEKGVNGPFNIIIDKRLPVFIPDALELTCYFSVLKYKDYYVLDLEVFGDVNIVCQRCLQTFIHSYKNKLGIAVCTSDAKAEELMSSSYECIVASDNTIDLVEVLTDELHLFCPEKHINITDCI